MITVPNAQQHVIDACRVMPSKSLPLAKALGHYIAQDIKSPIDMPAFRQSAMDGYALKYNDLVDRSSPQLKVVGEIKAGDSPATRLQTDQAVRIFTGAPVPEGADSVIIQEKTYKDNGHVKIKGSKICKGANIRPAGAQLKKGTIALRKGSKISPAAIGLLAAMGLQEVEVIPSPQVGIIATGSELKKPGQPLETGEIYESNSYMLQSALQSTGIAPAFRIQVNDNQHDTYQATERVMDEVDILITSGGISVGKYDFVRQALLEAGVKEIFYKVAQKPGKPLFFGRKGKTLVFGLAGNPAAALTSFYEYIYPAIHRKQGVSAPFLPKGRVKLLNAIHQKPNRACFYKGKINGHGVNILDGQQSFILKSFAEADCLVYVPKGNAHLSVWDKVEVHYLPHQSGQYG